MVCHSPSQFAGFRQLFQARFRSTIFQSWTLRQLDKRSSQYLGARSSPIPDLPRLLHALDGHALSIRLVAAQAAGLPTLRGPTRELGRCTCRILRRPGQKESRLTSVRASLLLSLNSGRVRSTPLARRLMSLLAFLPGGLEEVGVSGLLGDRGTVSKAKGNEAVACLHQLRLVERRPDRRLRMLTPLRECVKLDVPITWSLTRRASSIAIWRLRRGPEILEAIFG